MNSGSEGWEDDEISVESDIPLIDTRYLQRIKENNPDTERLNNERCDEYIQSMTEEGWEELGRDIANNTHLTEVTLMRNVINDQTMTCLFRGLTRSSSVQQMSLYRNQWSAVGVRSMVPFLQNANNLLHLDLSENNLQSEGFNVIFRALSDSPIAELICDSCGLESIEIDREHIPKHLEFLLLNNNLINADGCREVAKVLQTGDGTLDHLHLVNNKIDDVGVDILVDALKSNTSLTELILEGNSGISKRGKISLLKLVNDVSSIKATLQSNHTLIRIDLRVGSSDALEGTEDEKIKEYIEMATRSNRIEGNHLQHYYRHPSQLPCLQPEAAGKKKVIQTQLNSVRRAELAELQGVNHSFYSEIKPLHLPEVLSLVGRHHKQGELYAALKSSIDAVISTVNRKQCLQQYVAYQKAKIAKHRANMEAAETQIAAIEAAEVHALANVGNSHSNKRPRTS